MANYFNTLSLREQLEQLGQCEFMDRSEFDGGVAALKGKKNSYNWMWSARVEPRLEHERFWIGCILYIERCSNC